MHHLPLARALSLVRHTHTKVRWHVPQSTAWGEPREENITSPQRSVPLRPELYIDMTPTSHPPHSPLPNDQPLPPSWPPARHSHSFKCSGAMSSIGTATALATRGLSFVART